MVVMDIQRNMKTLPHEGLDARLLKLFNQKWAREMFASAPKCAQKTKLFMMLPASKGNNNIT
jgi:hypothetical protein